MLHMGFSDHWVNLIMSLYSEASATVLLNGQPGSTFKLQRLVRQGCPLAPYLYILVADVLGHMLDDEFRGLKGLTLPDGSSASNSMFADDTALYLVGETANLNTAMGILNLFCTASGAKLNWAKTVSIWAAQEERSWSWPEDPGILWLQPGQTTKLLGFPIGFRIPQEEINNKILLAVNWAIINWGANTLSLAGRIMISNQVTLASIWYLCSCASIKAAAFRQVRSVVRNYIWGAKTGQKTRAKIS